MVIPRSRSAFSLSSTHAYLKDPLPNSAASCKFCQYFECSYGLWCRQGCGSVVKAVTIRVICDRIARGKGFAPPTAEKPNNDHYGKMMPTFSNFSIVRLSIPPHL